MTTPSRPAPLPRPTLPGLPWRSRLRRAFIIVYALGVLALVSIIAATIWNAGTNEMKVGQRQMYLQLARSGGDAGIEYAMGIINHELADPSGPYFDPSYAAPFSWMVASDLVAGGETDPTKLEYAERMTPLMFDNEGTAGHSRYNVQFQVTMWPSFNYDNVRGNPGTLFYVRSRGEVALDYNGDGITDEIGASAYIVQTFTVIGIDPNCGIPASTRLLWEMDPANLGPIPWNAH